MNTKMRKIAVALSVAALGVSTAGTAVARNGADDPAGHHRDDAARHHHHHHARVARHGQREAGDDHGVDPQPHA